MKDLVFPRDRALTTLSLTIGILFWLMVAVGLYKWRGPAMIGGVLVTILVAAAVTFISYLFARSAAIAHLRGNAIEVTEQQLPQLHAQLAKCCEALSISIRPSMFIQNGNGVLNAFATWFLGRKYVILLSSVVDAMDRNSDGVRFYIGHELAHIIRHDNPIVAVLRWPALRLPLLGAAFSRARETTCDLHGLACCSSRDGAARSLSALAAGARNWADISLDAYRHQLLSAKGFWMSFHELVASYPWSVKRAIRVLDEHPQIPGRNPFAYVLALFVPYAGKIGAGVGLLLYVYFIGIVAAIAIPAYQSYTARAVFAAAITESYPARTALATYYETNKQVPTTLSVAGIPSTLPNNVELQLAPKGMILYVTAKVGELEFVPKLDDQGHVYWICLPGAGVRPQMVPLSCQQLGMNHRSAQ